jgi:hypothetical protein
MMRTQATINDRLVKALLFILLIAVSCLAQTPDDLQRKYGKPETLSKKSSPDRIERYRVRPGLSMTVKFANEAAICEMIFEPNLSSKEDRVATRVLSEDEARKIVEEFAPVAKRGRDIIKMTRPGHDCTSVTYNEYERVMIAVITRCEERGGGIHSVKIRWKATACESPGGARPLNASSFE